jgi:hypothetical protein
MEQGETPEYLTRRLIKRKQTMNYALRGGNDYAVSNYTKEICQSGLLYNGLNMYNDFKSKHCSQNFSELCSEAGKDQKNPGQNFPDHFRIEPNVCGLKLHTLS